MQLTLEIPSRVYDSITSVAKIRGITTEQYCTEAIMDRVFIERFGDLNEKASGHSINTAPQSTPIAATTECSAGANPEAEAIRSQEMPHQEPSEPSQKSKTKRRTLKK